MKTSNLFLLSLLLGSSLGTRAQVAGASSSSGAAVPPPTPWVIMSRGPNENTLQRTNYTLSPSGQVVAKVHTYKAIATGLNRRDPQTGQYIPSSEGIAILANGSAAGTNCEHQAFFPPDLYSGMIQLVTPAPDLYDLKCQPIAIGYDDGSNMVLFSVLTNSAGELLPSGNQVVYPNAFPGLGDVLFTYTLAGWEQDIVLRAQPPDPSAFGLNVPTTRIMVLTEFINSPQPVVTATTVSTDVGDMEDDNVSFGIMRTWPGKAFLLDTNWPPVPIGGVNIFKRWLVMDGGRTFLAEEVPLPDVADQLATLPPMAMNAGGAGSLPLASRHLVLPPRRVAKSPAKAIVVAKAAPPARGLVLDWQFIENNLTNFTFQGSTTYLVIESVAISGTTTIEGGTVIKFIQSPEASSIGCSAIVCETSPYHPAILTADHDNTVGETIGTGPPPYYPTNGYYVGGTGEALNIGTQTNELEYLRCCYLYEGIYPGGSSVIRNCQFINDYLPIYNAHNVSFENCLFQNVGSGDGIVFGVLHANVSLQNCTVVNSAKLGYGTAAYIAATNCLLIGVTNCSGFTGACNYTNLYDAGIFQTVGGGGNYLATDCPSGIRGAGTTNIDPVLLAQLQTKTTWAPIVYSNVTISTPTTFGPQAQRDCTGALDLGYHYDPIDWVFGGVQAGTNLAFTPGTSVGWFELTNTYAGNTYGIGLSNGVAATFTGTATAPCTFEQCNTVQEGENGVWPVHGGSPGGITAIDSYNTNSPPGLTAQFTHFYHLAGDSDVFQDGTNGQSLVVQAHHSEIWGTFGGCNLIGAFTNCLFVRCDFSQSSSNAYPSEIFRNCTFYGGTFDIVHNESGAPYWYSSVYNSAFDGTSISIDDPFGVNTNYADYNYNAYITNDDELSPEGTNNVVVIGGFNWQTNWFGTFYQSVSSPLIEQGSTTADQVGLYHFTTQTNQTIEGTNIVDIGYHYVAVTNGVRLDSNGDGIPDYLEDANGNGLVDSGEIGWNITGDLGLQVIITRPRNGGVLP